MISLFPFSKVKQGSSIILYGMGRNGRDYFRQLWATRYCSIKFAVDENWEHIHIDGLTIYPPEALKEEPDLPIVLTVADSRIYQEILHTLEAMGIKKERIIYEMLGIEENWNEKEMEDFRQLLHIKNVIGKNLVRIGQDNDGGYIMLDDFLHKGVAYSFGINNDVSWDAAMADRGYDIFMYDHTIQKLPYIRDEFHFFQYGIAETEKKDLNLNSLHNFIRMNGHNQCPHMILKMDVEGAEWAVLEEISSQILSQFDQMVFEFHRICDTEKDRNRILDILKKLNVTHQVIHVHANNYCIPKWDGKRGWAYAYEVTYVNRELYNFEEPINIDLPISIDMPCNPDMPELALGNWNHI